MSIWPVGPLPRYRALISTSRHSGSLWGSSGTRISSPSLLPVFALVRSTDARHCARSFYRAAVIEAYSAYSWGHRHYQTLSTCPFRLWYLRHRSSHISSTPPSGTCFIPARTCGVIWRLWVFLVRRRRSLRCGDQVLRLQSLITFTLFALDTHFAYKKPRRSQAMVFRPSGSLITLVHDHQ